MNNKKIPKWIKYTFGIILCLCMVSVIDVLFTKDNESSVSEKLFETLKDGSSILYQNVRAGDTVESSDFKVTLIEGEYFNVDNGKVYSCIGELSAKAEKEECEGAVLVGNLKSEHVFKKDYRVSDAVIPNVTYNDDSVLGGKVHVDSVGDVYTMFSKRDGNVKDGFVAVMSAEPNIFEDDTVKSRQQARSFNGSYRGKYVEYDGIDNLSITGNHFNLSSLELFLETNDKDVPFKVDGVQVDTVDFSKTVILSYDNILEHNYTLGNHSSTMTVTSADNRSFKDTMFDSKNDPARNYGGASDMYLLENHDSDNNWGAVYIDLEQFTGSGVTIEKAYWQPYINNIYGTANAYFRFINFEINWTQGEEAADVDQNSSHNSPYGVGDGDIEVNYEHADGTGAWTTQPNEHGELKADMIGSVLNLSDVPALIDDAYYNFTFDPSAVQEWIDGDNYGFAINVTSNSLEQGMVVDTIEKGANFWKFYVEYSPANTAPIWSEIADIEKAEDFVNFTLDLSDNITDDSDSDGDLQISYILNSSDWIATMDNSTDELVIGFWTANVSGVVNVSLTLVDTAGLTDFESFDLIVNAVNDAPNFAPSTNIVKTEDFSNFTIDWGLNISDVDDTDLEISYTLNDSNWVMSHVNATNISTIGFFTGNASGSVNISLWLTDDGGAYAFESFILTTIADDDLPWTDTISNTSYYVAEDGSEQPIENNGSSFNASLYFRDVEDDQSPVNFTINTNTTSVTCDIKTNHTVFCTPTLNLTGSFTLILNGTDSNNTQTINSFDINITDVNDNPWWEPISNIERDEGFDDFTINLSPNISDVEDDDTTLEISFNSNDSDLEILSLDNSTNIMTIHWAGTNLTTDVSVNVSLILVDSNNAQVPLSFDIILRDVNQKPWWDSITNQTTISISTVGYHPVLNASQYWWDVEDGQAPTNISVSTNESSIICYVADNIGVSNNWSLFCSSTNFQGLVIITLNGSDSGWLSETNSFEIITDTKAPTLTFAFQIPSDIDASNLLGTTAFLNISYTNDTGEVSLPITNRLYYKINNSLDNNLIYVNGSFWYDDFIDYDYTETNNETDFYFTLEEREVYPATYNINETLIRDGGVNEVLKVYDLDNNNEYIKMEFYNISSIKDFNFFEVQAINQTGNSLNLRMYYCNDSYSTGNPVTIDECTNFYNLDSSEVFNHSHSGDVPVNHSISSMGILNGLIGDVIVTDVSYILLRGRIGLNAWDIYYIDDVSRDGAYQTTINNGVTWIEFTGTFVAHPHQYSNDETFHYFVESCDSIGNCRNHTVRSDDIEVMPLPPNAPDVYAPIKGNFSGNISINYTEFISPSGHELAYYNITLVDSSHVWQHNINPILNETEYYWNTREVTDGLYHIEVEVFDNRSLSSIGHSENIDINNTPWWDTIDNSTYTIDEDTGSQYIHNASFFFRDYFDDQTPSTIDVSDNATDVSCTIEVDLTLECNPTNNYTGPFIVTFNGTDSDDVSAFTSFEVIVTAYNDQPWWNTLPNNTVLITEDTGNQNVSINASDYWYDVEDTDYTPTLSIVDDNETDITCAMDTGDIECSPTNNFTGPFILTINGTDSGYNSAITSFEIFVSAVNDAPWWEELINNTVSITEDVPNAIIYQNDTFSLNFRDHEDDYTRNDPDNNGVYDTNETDVTCLSDIDRIVCSPNNNFTGSFILIITEQDMGGSSATTSVEVTVTNVNDIPMIDYVGPIYFEEDTPFEVDLTSNKSDPDTGETLTWTFVLNDTTLISVIIDNSTDNVSFFPQINGSGVVEMNLSLWDSSLLGDSELIYIYIGAVPDIIEWRPINETGGTHNITYTEGDEASFNVTILNATESHWYEWLLDNIWQTASEAFNWVIPYEHMEGTHNVSVFINNSRDKIDWKTWIVSVLNFNQDAVVTDLSQLPITTLWNYSNISVFCNVTDEDYEPDNLTVEIGYRLYGDTGWQTNATPIVWDDTVTTQYWKTNVTTQPNSSWIGSLDFRCRVSDGEGWSAWTIDLDTVNVTETPIAPTVPTSISPSKGIFSTYIPINCSGATDPNLNDTVYYDIEIHYQNWSHSSSDWHMIASNHSTGIIAFPLYSIPAQLNVSIRCRASDLVYVSSYYESGVNLTTVRFRGVMINSLKSLDVYNASQKERFYGSLKCDFNDGDEIFIDASYVDCNNDGVWDRSWDYSQHGTNIVNNMFTCYNTEPGNTTVTVGCIVRKLANESWPSDICGTVDAKFNHCDIRTSGVYGVVI